ncbi:MAG: hypothetical protein WBV31_07300 [Terriglobales bacterium]
MAAVKKLAPLMVGFCTIETTGPSDIFSAGATDALSTRVKLAVALEFGTGSAAVNS